MDSTLCELLLRDTWLQLAARWEAATIRRQMEWLLALLQALSCQLRTSTGQPAVVVSSCRRLFRLAGAVCGSLAALLPAGERLKPLCRPGLDVEAVAAAWPDSSSLGEPEAVEFLKQTAGDYNLLCNQCDAALKSAQDCRNSLGGALRCALTLARAAQPSRDGLNLEQSRQQAWLDQALKSAEIGNNDQVRKEMSFGQQVVFEFLFRNAAMQFS